MEKLFGTENVNEKRLFHGTKGGDAVVENICKNNFDFRNSGKSSGTLYGHGK